MSVCALCHGHEHEPPSTPGRGFIVFVCCNDPVCTHCLAPALTTGLETDLFHNLKGDFFLFCPTGGCGGIVHFASARDLRIFYDSVGVPHDVEVHAEVFDRALARRAALRPVVRDPDHDLADRAAELHRDLHAAGVARHLLGGEDEGEVEVEMVPVLCDFGPEPVPVFTSLLRRKEGRTCSVCTEDLRDAHIPHPQAWKRLTDKFRGDLHFLAERFPAPETLPSCAASHELDICKACISRHIGAQLEERGAVAVGAIACPAACAHVYTAEDIRDLANTETAAEYERLGLVGLLAKEPSFRWCLRPGCGNGASYDASPGCCAGAALSADMARALGADAGVPHRIVCRECGFAMCFECQAPWHRGLSCEELASRAGGGDPSAAWLARNTKRCPGAGCGVMIEKGNACFHMMCTECGAEWCWECQADWREIFPPGGSYVLTAHREGCFFRVDGAPHPMFLQGGTIEEAVARNERPGFGRGVMEGGLG